jgi:PAS domain S-box-containing protein
MIDKIDIESLDSAIFNNLKLGIGVFSLDGKLVKANDRLCEWMGYSLEQLKNIKIYDHLFGESVDVVKKNMGETSETPYQIQVKTKSGRLAWIEIFSTTIVNSGVNYRVAAFRDISIQKQIENEQLESDKKYRLLFENMNEAFALHKIITDENNKPIDFEYIDVNSSFERITGLKKTDIIHKRVMKIMPNLEPYWFENFGNVALTGIPNTYSNYVESWGKYIETHTYCPQKEYFAVVFSDITDRWKAEVELELHNQRLEILVRLSESKIHNLSDILYYCTRETTFFAKGNFGFSLFIDELNDSDIVTLWDQNSNYEVSDSQIQYLKKASKTLNKNTHHFEIDDAIIDSPFKQQIITIGNKYDRFFGFSVYGNSNIQLILVVGIKPRELSNSLTTNISLLLEGILQIAEKQRFFEQVVKEKEKAEINESRFFEIQKIGKIGWYEALLKENLFLGSFETYDIFFDEIYDFAVSQEHLKEAIHPDDREHFFNTVKRNIELKTTEFEWEYRVISPINGIKHIYSKAFVKYDDQGNMIRRYGIVQDITETKKNELAIKKHSDRLESLFKIAQLTYTKDVDLLQKAINEALKLTSSNIGFVFSFDKEKELVNLVSFLENNLSKEIIYAFRDTVIRTKKEFMVSLLKMEKAYLDNDIIENRQLINEVFGNDTDYRNLMLVPISINKTESLWIIVFNKTHLFTDVDVKQITLLMDNVWKVIERQKYQEELIQAKEKAEESDKLKSAFLANMSHEIRTPMNGIIGFSELFIQENITPDKRKSYANIVIESGKQLLSIVDDILDFSKIEVGQVNICKQPVIVNDVITELFSFYSPKAKESNLSLFPYKDLSDNLSIVITDKQRLIQVLNNLLSNSFKFTNKGQISFGYLKKSDVLEFFVKDTGSGIPIHMQEAVFDRFVQVENTTIQKTRGTGLGLSISQKLVHLLGGEICLESKENVGTSFYFTLPYYSDNEDKISRIENQANQISPSLKTILVAEDEEINFLYINEILSNAETRILHAANGI